MKVYFVSGLGADSRVFRHIRLPDGYDAVHLAWIEPVQKESLKEYALRLAAKIDRSEKYILIGLSMGGMIAAEIANHFASSKTTAPLLTILISSIPVSTQFPLHFKIARILKLYKIVPVKILKSASLLKRFFTNDSPDDKILLAQVVRDSDPVFIRWAIEAALNWKNDIVPEPLVHIHGSADRILPSRNTNPTFLINKGSHLMLLDRAAELNSRIAEALLSVK